MKLHDAQYWKDRPLTPDDKDWIDNQPNWVESYVHSTYHPHRQLIVDALVEIPFESALEIGCNTGSNLIRIHELFPEVKLAGIDVNKKCINKAKGFLGKATFKVSDYHSIPFPDKSFDVVLADAVLMYSSPKQIAKAMSEIDRVAKQVVIIVDRLDKSKSGVRNGHVWARNYPTILKNLGFNVNAKKITKQLWPKSIGWQRFGYLFVGIR